MRKHALTFSALVLAGMVMTMAALAEQAQDLFVKAAIKSIAPDFKNMKVEAGTKVLTMNLTAQTKVSIGGVPGTLSQLKLGDVCDFTCQKTDLPDTYKCSEIKKK